MEFNQKLQALRKQKGLTQEELAGFLHVSRTAVSKWESGRGYPGIDLLKALSAFYAVSIDELLSGEELLTAAQENVRQKESSFCDQTAGMLDCGMALLFFLPFFGQQANGALQTVSLAGLTAIQPWLRICYWAVVICVVLTGLLTLALQNCQHAFWSRSKRALSLTGSAAGTFLFIAGRQPYAAALTFALLIFKALLLRKRQ